MTMMTMEIISGDDDDDDVNDDGVDADGVNSYYLPHVRMQLISEFAHVVRLKAEIMPKSASFASNKIN